MSTQNTPLPKKEGDPQKQTAENSNKDQQTHVSLPHNNDVQVGPFPHSGETSRQTEEARIEVEEQKEE